MLRVSKWGKRGGFLDEIGLSDEELVTLPPPAGLILCRLINVPTPKGENGYLKCKRCPDHIACVRYLEAESWVKGIDWNRSKFNKEEEKECMERYLHSVGYTCKETN